METKNETQCQLIWRMLQAGKRITSYDAFILGITRLAARVFDLRERYGRDSISAVRHPDGYAIYSLNKKES